MRWIDRKSELQQLSRLRAHPRAQLLVVSGRPGLGKTTLIRQWLKTQGHAALYWTAEHAAADEQLRSFSQAMRRHFFPDVPLEPGFTYPDWKAALAETGHLSQQERRMVVIDNFDHLLEADRGVASDVKVSWDFELEQGQIFLILISSELVRLRQEVLSYHAPLFGRLTAHMRLRPFSFGDLARIVPGDPAADRVALLAATGGLPGYLKMIDPRQPLEANLRRLLAGNDYQGSLDHLLRQPAMQRPKEYQAVLKALARGPGSATVLARRTGLSERRIWWRLMDLEMLRLAAVRHPVTGPYQIAARGGRARLIDFQAGFHALFVEPHRAALRRGDDRAAWRAIRRGLDRYIAGTVFPAVCWDWLYREWGAGRLIRGGVSGGYWAPGQPDVDFVLIQEDDHQIVVGTSLWSRKPMGEKVVVDLVRRSLRVVPAPHADWTFTYVFFSRLGFTLGARRAGRRLNCLWVDLERLDHALGQEPPRIG